MASPISVSQRAVLLIPEVGRLFARATEVGDGHVTLSLVSPAKLMLLAYDATLVYSAGGEDRWLAGVARRAPGVANALRFEFDPERQIRHRRQGMRVDAVLPVKVSASGTSAPARSETRDVSTAGTLIVDPFHSEVGDMLGLELELPDGRRPLKLSGQVMRKVGDDLRGIRFDRVSDRDRLRLTLFLFSRQAQSQEPALA